MPGKKTEQTPTPRSCPVHPEGQTPREDKKDKVTSPKVTSPKVTSPKVTSPKVTLLWQELEAFGGDVLYEPTEGALWVRTPRENRLVKYTGDGRVARCMPAVNFRAANGRLCYDVTRRWVVTCDETRVVCHALNGHLTREVKVKGAQDLEGVMYCRDADVYVTSDVKKNCLYVIDAKTGLVSGSFGSKGSKNNEDFDSPGYLCMGKSRDKECACVHHIVVSDKGNNCIKLFTSGGEFLRKFGVGELSAPTGVCEDQLGRLVVCDSGNQRVVRFWMEDGKEKHDVILTSDDLEGDPPRGITVNKEGHLVVGKGDGRGTMVCFKIEE